MQQLEHRAVGADALQPRHIPWDEGDDDKDRAQIKNRDTPDHRVGGAHDMFIRGIRFGGGDGDDLRAHKREHGDQHRAQHRAEAVRHKAAVVPQPRNAADLGIGIKTGNGDRAQYDKRQNSDHFAQRQPELEFAVVLDAQQVTAGEGESDDQGEQPHRDARHPRMQNNRRDIGFQRNNQDPEPPVQPADGIPRPAADGFIGVGGKGAGIRRGDRHFGQHTHNHHHQQPGKQIGQQHRRACLGNGDAGSDK